MITRIQPVSLETASALIGAGVDYTGDMANQAGRGAVVSMEPCGSWGPCVTVILEDGRKWPGVRPSELIQAPTPGQRIRGNGQRHGADYLAQLIGAAATKKASEAAAADAARDAFARAVAQLKADHPGLTIGSDRKTATANMRTMLRATFPGVKFSVRSERSSIDVSWTDGPTEAAVQALTGRFEHGSFDGMTDCYNYSRAPWGETFGGVDYVFERRDYSDALIERAIAACVAEYGSANVPTVADWRMGRAWQTMPHADSAWSDHWSWQSIINRQAASMAG